MSLSFLSRRAVAQQSLPSQVRRLAILPLLDPSPVKASSGGGGGYGGGGSRLDRSRPAAGGVIGDAASATNVGAGANEQLAGGAGGSVTEETSPARAAAFVGASTHMTKRSSVMGNSTPALVRHFNTSTPVRAAWDTSTIDFAFLPTQREAGPSNEAIRVPLLPDTLASARSSVARASEEVEPVVFRAEIATAAHESTFPHPPSAMSDVVDNGAMQLDPFDFVNSVGQAARQLGRKVTAETAQKKGVLSQLWNGLIDDIFGAPKLGTA